MKMRHLLLGLSLCLCLLMTACESRVQGTSLQEPQESQSVAPEENSHEESSLLDDSNETQNAANSEVGAELSNEERFNEIMCIFGAERKTEYNNNGEPVESDTVEYQTSVISFYYYDEGISSVKEITPYGYFGWYLEYTSGREEDIRKVMPNFERMVLVRNDLVSGEIYGAPADSYEAIVTSFFDVDVEELRSNDLYNKEANAYVPITGPGIGERPTVRVASGKRDGDFIVLDIEVESSPARAYKLTVREDKSNSLEGIKFVSLAPSSKAEAKFTDGPNGSSKASLKVGDSFLGFKLDSLVVEYDNGELQSLNAHFTGKITLTGKLSYEELEGPNMVRFVVAEESSPLLPYPVGDTREVWFGFSNGDDAVKQMVGKDTFDMDCEIVIDSYTIDFAYAGVWNKASMVEIQPLDNNK